MEEEALFSFRAPGSDDDDGKLPFQNFFQSSERLITF